MLDLLGFNYYYNNQWLYNYESFLPWANEDNDPRWRPLSGLLADAYKRYKRPIVITETSHPGEHRPQWITFIADQCAKVINMGIPFYGVCLYPIIDRPDWDDLDHWHKSGLWDNITIESGTAERILFEPYAHALREAQNSVFTAQRLHNETRSATQQTSPY